MAKIEITSEGGMTQIKVDGAPVKCCTGASVDFGIAKTPEVTLNLIAMGGSFDLSDARLKIGGIEAPESLERAILAYLGEKYAPKAPVINVVNTIGGIASPEEIASAVRTVRAEILRDRLIVGRVVGDAGPELRLPTPEEMQPAVRSVVQSVADNLLKLPVREMSPQPTPMNWRAGRPYTKQELADWKAGRRAARARFDEQCGSPAGLTRTAFDRERPNGRAGG